MEIDFRYGLTIFTAIFAIFDPMGNIPLFYTITQRFLREERLQIVKKAVIAAIVTLVVFGLISQYIFTLFSITITAFHIAVGITVISSCV